MRHTKSRLCRRASVVAATLSLGAALLVVRLDEPAALAKTGQQTEPSRPHRARPPRVVVRPVQTFVGPHAELYRRVAAVRTGQEWLALPEADRKEILGDPWYHVEAGNLSHPANLRKTESLALDEIREPRMRAFAQLMRDTLLDQFGEPETDPYYADGPLSATAELVYLDSGELLGGCLRLRQELIFDHQDREPCGNYQLSGTFQATPAQAGGHLFRNLGATLIGGGDYWEYDH
ncbi:MAG: hypothetical protein IT371_30930 [Deltaproteobacteria bacterium]|nr:hypothetical protein [Deltaproteobacteria bacterium]